MDNHFTKWNPLKYIRELIPNLSLELFTEKYTVKIIDLIGNKNITFTISAIHKLNSTFDTAILLVLTKHVDTQTLPNNHTQVTDNSEHPKV